MQLWRHRSDPELGGIREMKEGVNGVPQVFTLKEEAFRLTQQWQYYVRGINYAMTRRHVSAIFGYFRAFSNGTGFGDATDKRKNYFLNESLDAPEFPQLDKIRTCARSVLTGTESRDDLLLTMLDGNEPPKLKPGRIYPTSIERVNVDDYMYVPRTHPWYFFVANNIQRDGETVPFSDDGGIYSWIGDGRPVTFLPHVCRSTVWYSKSRLIKLPIGSVIPSPYA